MTTSEKVAYLKGLAEGMGVQEDAGQGKLFKVIIDILEDLALDTADTRDALMDLADSVEELTEELEELEEECCDCPCCCCDDDDEDDEDDEDPVFYSLECPGCGYTLTVDEDILDEDAFECPECGEVIDFSTATLKLITFDDEDEDEDD